MGSVSTATFLAMRFPPVDLFQPLHKDSLHSSIREKKSLMVGFCLLVMLCFHFAKAFLAVTSVPALSPPPSKGFPSVPRSTTAAPFH